MKKRALSLFVLLCCLAATASAEEYIFATPPFLAAEQLTVMLQPLVTWLSQETGNDIKLLLPENTDQYTAEILHGNIVIGYESPSVYVNISNVHQAVAGAVTAPQDTRSKGIIISRPKSGISAVEDVKGKKIMIVGRNSVGGFLSQKLTLKEKGIDVERDCELSEAADHREENVIISVSIGDVDAGFISEKALRDADQYIAPGSVAVVVKTAPLPDWVISVSRNMPQVQQDDIREALLRLTPDDPILKSLESSPLKARMMPIMILSGIL